MKKFIVIALVLVFIVSAFASCGEKECTRCVGSGKVECYIKVGASITGSSHGYDCRQCNGTGWIKCDTCNGTGIAPSDK